jgi:hypothetical protein
MPWRARDRAWVNRRARASATDRTRVMLAEVAARRDLRAEGLDPDRDVRAYAAAILRHLPTEDPTLVADRRQALEEMTEPDLPDLTGGMVVIPDDVTDAEIRAARRRYRAGNRDENTMRLNRLYDRIGKARRAAGRRLIDEWIEAVTELAGQGLPWPMVAARLDLTESAVKRRLQRHDRRDLLYRITNNGEASANRGKAEQNQRRAIERIAS